MILRIGPQTYTVEVKDKQWVEESGAHGRCDSGQCLLQITDGARFIDTLWHELGHAIYYEYHIREVVGEEAINSLYMSGILQVLRDNPELKDNLWTNVL